MKKAPALIALCLVATGAVAADRPTFEVKVRATGGAQVSKVATAEHRSTDGFANPCPIRMRLGGEAEDGVRHLRCDGTGSYVDGTRSGELKWGYALSPTDKDKLVVKSFNAWQVDQIASDAPAAQIYLEFTDGPLKGRGFTEVIGVTNGMVAMSPFYFGKK